MHRKLGLARFWPTFPLIRQNVAVFQGISFSARNPISSPALKRRLPRAYHGTDINFCRNPQRGLLVVPPDPIDKRGDGGSKVQSNFPRGSVIGYDSETTFKCGACGQSPMLKNSKAREAHTGLHRKSGKTAKGVQRWKCKACLCTYSVGSSIKPQKRCHVNRDILLMLTNGTPISKICDFTQCSARDVYVKMDSSLIRSSISPRVENESSIRSIRRWPAGGMQPTAIPSISTSQTNARALKALCSTFAKRAATPATLWRRTSLSIRKWHCMRLRPRWQHMVISTYRVHVENRQEVVPNQSSRNTSTRSPRR